MSIRIVKRVSENYLLDPDTNICYNLRPVKKKTTEQQFLDDITAQAALCVAAEQGKAGKVYRPCAYLLQSQIDAMADKVVDQASENTYLMLFDPGCSKPSESDFDVAPWNQIDACVLIWSSDNVVYTWLTPDGLSMRFQTVPEAEARAEAFETYSEGGSSDDTKKEDDSPESTSSGETTLHIYCPHCGEKIF